MILNAKKTKEMLHQGNCNYLQALKFSFLEYCLCPTLSTEPSVPTFPILKTFEVSHTDIVRNW